MGVTIATHNGSAVRRDHNIRNRNVTDKQEHIDVNGEYEIWHDEKERDAYDRLFGQAQADYNAKQMRDDRKIKNYYNDVRDDAKKHTAYEMIIGVYGQNENGTPICSAEQGKEIMREFVDNWRERNPNLELIGAYYHADEQGEPHVHIDYIPVAHGYKRGMETQNGLVKALGEMGFEKQGKATAQIQWEKRENGYLERLCHERGLEVEHPKNEKAKHLDTATYKAEKHLESTIDHTVDLDNINTALKRDNDVLQAKNDKLKSELEYSKDGIVQVGLIATKEKIRDIEQQNKALKRELGIVVAENEKLKAEKAQIYADRGNEHRVALDALSKVQIYDEFMAKMREQTDKYDIVMQPYEDKVAKTHKLGQELLEHKKMYVYSLETCKTLKNEIKDLQSKESIAQANYNGMTAVYDVIKASSDKIEALKQEKSNLSALQLIKKHECDRQIKELSATIHKNEDILKEKYDMTNTTTTFITEEIKWHESEVARCKHLINEKTSQADSWADAAKVHLNKYKRIHKALEVTEKPCKDIINRYDKEYEPPQEYKFDLIPSNKHGLSLDKDQAKKDMLMTINEMEQLIDERRATNMLEKMDKQPMREKTHIHESIHER